MIHEEVLKKLEEISKYDKLNYYKLEDSYKEDFNKESCNVQIFDQLKKDKIPSEEDFVEIPYTSSGDYTNFSCVSNMSNNRILMKDFKDLILIYGSYSYETLFIQLKDLQKEENEELFNIIDDLFQYPILDEQDESELINELAEKAWNNWLEYDFKRELYKYLDEDKYELEDYDLKSIFYKFIEITGDYFESDGNDVYIHINDIVQTMVQKHNDEFWEIINEHRNM